MTNPKDVLAFGSARAYKLAEEDESARFMYQLNRKDGPTPFYLSGQDPLDAIEDVARGLIEADAILFLGERHIIQIEQWEWSLDGDLSLWREASIYAEHLQESGLLDRTREDGRTEYRRAQVGPCRCWLCEVWQHLVRVGGGAEGEDANVLLPSLEPLAGVGWGIRPHSWRRERLTCA